MAFLSSGRWSQPGLLHIDRALFNDVKLVDTNQIIDIYVFAIFN